jgi:hypothetical protein
MAEREGFEPPVAFRLRLISSQVHSTGLCHLSVVFRAFRLACTGPFRWREIDASDKTDDWTSHQRCTGRRAGNRAASSSASDMQVHYGEEPR